MKDPESLSRENEELKARLAEAEELIAAIKSGAVDAVVTEDSRVLSSEGVGYAYMVLVETMGDGAATLTPSGAIISCNGRLARMLGLPEAEIPGLTIFKFFSPEEEKRLAVLMTRMDGTGEHEEFTLRANDGKELPVLISCSPLKPKVDAIGIIITDLTAQKKAAAELKNSEAKYRALFDRAFDAFLLLEVRPDGTPVIVDANESALSMHGFSRDELIGQPLAFLDDKDAPEPLLHGRSERILSASGAIFEARHRRKDGRPLDLEVSVQPVDVGGKVLQLDISRDITDRKRADREMRSTLERLKIASEAAKAGSWEWDLRTGENLWSPELYKVYGVDPAKVKPSYASWLEIVHPEDRAAAERTVQEAAKAGRELDFEFRTSDTGSRTLHSFGRPIAGEDGKPERYVGMVLDLTDRTMAENSVREAKLALEEAQRVARLGSWSYDVASDRSTWSAEMFRIFGVDPAAGEPDWEAHRKLIYPEDWPAIDAAVKKAINEGEPYEVAFRTVIPATEPLWAVSIGKAEKDASGKVMRLYGTTQDITEHKKSEAKILEALDKQRVLNAMLHRSVEPTTLPEKLQGHLESLLDLPWLAIMPKGAIFVANSIRKEMEMICHKGLPPEVIQSCSKVQPGNCVCGQALQTGEVVETARIGPEHTVTYPGILPHGHYCAPITASGRTLGVLNLYLKEGTVLSDDQRSFLASATDIMAENILHAQAEEKFSQAQKMESVGRLAGGVAHDFNNLLTAINGYAGFLLRRLPETDPKRDDVKEIIAAADRAAALTRQLLAFSRKQILSPRVLDLNAAVGGMVKMLTRLIGEDIQLETRLEHQACTVKVDPGQMDQLVVNLAVNARDAMPQGGRLLLETELLTRAESVFLKYPDFQRGPVVRLSIKDNGCGMSGDIKAHVFEPFFTTKEKGHGTGLGLAMVFGIVKQSGGEIEVESEPGSGTTFNIYLPCPVQGTEKGNGQGETRGIAAGSETILLVEDEDSLRRFGERVLRESGYAVIAASNAKEALKLIENHGKPVDLLMTDVVMPGMSGRELAKELDRRKLTRRTLFMSGYTDDAIVKHGVLEEGIAFIYKPFSVEDLTAKIREVLDGPAEKAKP